MLMVRGRRGIGWLRLQATCSVELENEDEKICARGGAGCNLRSKASLIGDGVGIGDCAHGHERGEGQRRLKWIWNRICEESTR
jgi:hypothetical protein